MMNAFEAYGDSELEPGHGRSTPNREELADGSSLWRTAGWFRKGLSTMARAMKVRRDERLSEAELLYADLEARDAADPEWAAAAKREEVRAALAADVPAAALAPVYGADLVQSELNRLHPEDEPKRATG